MTITDRCRNCRYFEDYIGDKVKCWIKHSNLVNDSSNCQFHAPKFSY